jgi:hypothetical protein
MIGATRGTHATRHRWRRRRCRGGTPSAEIAKASTVGDASASTALRFVLGPDPLAEALGVRPDPLDLLVSVDPMMDELAVVLVTRSAVAPASGCRSLGGHTSLWDPTSTAPQCTAESPPSSPVQGAPAFAVAPSEEFLPSPGDAPAGLVSSVGGGLRQLPSARRTLRHRLCRVHLRHHWWALRRCRRTSRLPLLSRRQPGDWPGSLRWSGWRGHHPSSVLPPGKRRRPGGPRPRGVGGLPLRGWTTSQHPNAAKCSS